MYAHNPGNRRVARVRTSNMRAAGCLETRGIVVFKEKSVVPTRIGTKFGIVMKGTKRQWCALLQRPIIFAARSSSSVSLDAFAFRYLRKSATR
jgi:hypothetical protein